MKYFLCVSLLAVLATVLSDNPLKFQPQWKNLADKHRSVLNELSKYNVDGDSELFELFKVLLGQSGNSNTNLKNLKGFKFNDCGGKIAVIKSLVVTPDPIQLPGDIGLSAKILLKSPIKTDTPVFAALTIKKQLFGKYITIPCIDGFGSCNYTDVCQELDSVSNCPQFLIDNKIPCHCPYKPGTYKLPQATISIGAAAFESGNYIVTAKFTYKNSLAACLNATFTIAP